MEQRQVEARKTTACRASGDDAARFLKELRQLRDGAGLGPAELAARAHYPYDRIRAAEVGPALPDLPVLSAYVRGCGGTSEEWEERWRSLTSAPTLPLLAARPAGSSTAADAGARIGSTSPAAETPDPSIILAALDRVAEGMAVGQASAPAPAPASASAPWETSTGSAWGTASAPSAWETDRASAAAAPAESASGAAEATEAKATEAGVSDDGASDDGAADTGAADAGRAAMAPPWSTAVAPTTGETAVTQAAAARATPAPATPAPAVSAPAGPTAASATRARRVHGRQDPALSRNAVIALIAALVCVVIAVLVIFA